VLQSGTLYVVERAQARALTMHQLFSPYALNYATNSGLYVTAVTLVTSVLVAFVFEFVVERSRLCLDFAVTLRFVHVVACIVYTETFPAWWYFWLVQCVCALVTACVAQFRCRQREMMDIPRRQVRKAATTTSTTATTSTGSTNTSAANAVVNV
jgi:hypothetical protein